MINSYSKSANMKTNKILGITINLESRTSILEKILLYIGKPTCFFHIVSLNPENLIATTESEIFKKVVETAQIKIVDGIGVVLAGRWLGVETGERVTGVGLMEDLLKMASDRRLRVLMIGGKENLALRLAQCYQEKYIEAKFNGIQGIVDIQDPSEDEEDKIFSIVTAYKPHLVFVAFGSPAQELWIERHKNKLTNCVAMGVGGAFDYLSGNVNRSPTFIQKIGLEWLYRLVIQPWRWKRQLRLLKFIWLIIKQKLKK
ncbi:Glycosyl transferase, WecB/TagA/CpsF family [Candidatus Roizmanbacteria bacterium]|nr:Glycosyl transferase, WecB/TagA/CpsF family [Candidatus Roizmanbacteria bacterium]